MNAATIPRDAVSGWILTCRRGKSHGPVAVYVEHKPSGVCPCGVSMLVERKGNR